MSLLSDDEIRKLAEEVIQDNAMEAFEFAKKLIEAQHTKDQEEIKKEREKFQAHMQCFPSSLYQMRKKCICDGCKWYQAYEEQTGKDGFAIGWCRRFEPDPDAGYVLAYQLPPCIVWAFEKGEDDEMLDL
jgi:hypothetical protein